MFTPRVMVINMSKWLVFCIFYWWQQKISHNLGKICKCIWKILFRSFRKCCHFVLPFGRCRPLKMQSYGIFCCLSSFFFLHFYSQYFTNGNFKPCYPYHFLKGLNTIFQMHLNVLPKLNAFLLPLAENTKSEPLLTH